MSSSSARIRRKKRASEPIDLLIVEDDRDLLETLEMVFSEEEFGVVTATNFEDVWRQIESSSGFDVALLDLHVGRTTALEAIPELRKRIPALEVIIMTAQAEVESAVAAMKAGAHDYIVKGVPISALVQAVTNAHEKSRLRRENAALRNHVMGAVAPTTPFVAESPLTKQVLALIDKLAPVDLPVLILGETGTGKDLVARRLHAMGRGASGASYIPINCAAIPRELVMSELFGHERGAFTGANDRRPGMVELASGGTFFLDEVGDMPPEVQVALLRFLETGEFRRVGGHTLLKSDARVVAATNRDLRAEANAGRFREDLLFRLAVAPIEVPPLRDRPEDVGPLVGLFLEEFEKEIEDVEPEAMEALRRYAWPGNVREVRNVVCRAATFCTDGVIGVEDLPAGVREASGTTTRDVAQLSFREMESYYLEQVLERFDGNKMRAARAMGIDVRTLYSKLKKLDMDDDPRWTSGVR